MKIEVGTAETVVEKKTRKRTHLSSGKGSNGGNKNRGGGGGDDGNNGHNQPQSQDFREAEEEFKPDKFRLVMWFLLLIVLMTFGGLVSAYLVISTNGVAEWKPFALPAQIWISTGLLIASSVTYQIANHKLKNYHQHSARLFLMATTVLGATFISSQILAWYALSRSGIYVESNPYAGFFYILTAVHAAHVVGGIIALGYIVLRTWRETSAEDELLQRRTISKVVGWYWHFMDGLWLFLVLLLCFWK